MKTPLLVTLAFILLVVSSTANPLTIQEALDKKIVNIDVKASDESTHYITPLQVSLSNTSAQTVEVLIPNGLVFEAGDAAYQNFIVTEQLLVVLPPKGSATKPLSSMCIESSDMAPGDGLPYHIGAMAPKNMVKLSNYIEENKRFDPDGQFLMWELADGSFDDVSIHSFQIDDFGDIKVLIKKENDELIVANATPEVIEEPAVTKEFFGSFNLNLASEKDIHIAMFNDNGVLVKELYNNPQTPSGQTQIDYSFDSLTFTDEIYHVKLVMNNKVMMHRVVEMN